MSSGSVTDVSVTSVRFSSGWPSASTSRSGISSTGSATSKDMSSTAGISSKSMPSSLSTSSGRASLSFALNSSVRERSERSPKSICSSSGSGWTARSINWEMPWDTLSGTAWTFCAAATASTISNSALWPPLIWEKNSSSFSSFPSRAHS